MISRENRRLRISRACKCREMANLEFEMTDQVDMTHAQALRYFACCADEYSRTVTIKARGYPTWYRRFCAAGCKSDARPRRRPPPASPPMLLPCNASPTFDIEYAATLLSSASASLGATHIIFTTCTCGSFYCRSALEVVRSIIRAPCFRVQQRCWIRWLQAHHWQSAIVQKFQCGHYSLHIYNDCVH